MSPSEIMLLCLVDVGLLQSAKRRFVCMRVSRNIKKGARPENKQCTDLFVLYTVIHYFSLYIQYSTAREQANATQS